MRQCLICKEWILYTGQHECLPSFFVIDSDYWEPDKFEVPRWERHGAEIYAYDEEEEEEAAKKFSEDEDDSASEGPLERTVYVLNKDTNSVTRFEITYDYSINYYAHEIEGD